MSSTPRRSVEAVAAIQIPEPADDEKTIREAAGASTQVLSEKKDTEPGNADAASDAPQVAVDTYDDFPEGGMKAWLVVLGVSGMSRRLAFSC